LNKIYQPQTHVHYKLKMINNNQPLEVVVEVKEEENSFISCIGMFCIFLIFITITIPFYIADLSFAYTDTSCVSTSIPMTITLKDWLLVDGYFGLSVWFFVLFFGFIGSYNYNVSFIDSTEKIHNIIRIPIALFAISWLIVGSVIFWKYLEPTSQCNKSISDYMWARLIIGYLSHYNFKSRNNR